MFINKKDVEQGVVIEIEGRLDTINSPKLEEVLLPLLDENPQVTLDFADVDYISSAGLRILLIGQKKAKANKTMLTLIHVPPVVMSVLIMTGFTEILNVS